MNIILVGLSGTGKTTIAKELSGRTKFRLLDTDDYIRKICNMTIEDIFSLKGEGYFRDLETKIIKEFTGNNYVIATGGGIVLREENRDILKSIGTNILLKASPKTIIRNLKKSKEVRPLLKDDKSLEDDLESMAKTRKHLYELVSDFSIIIDGKSVEQIANEILQIINY